MNYSLRLKAYQNKVLTWEMVGLVSILIIEIILTYNRVLYGIDFALISLPAEGGYRIFSGQVPSRDFYTPSGFTFFYILAGFFHMFGGFTFKAVALYSAVMGAIATVAVFMILRLYLGAIASLFFAGVTALTFYMPRRHPWLDETAVLFYVLALASFIFAYRYRDKLSHIKITSLAALCGLLITASIFQKHNIGLTAMVFTAPLWLFISFGKSDNLIARAKGFGICLLSTLLSVLILVGYFESKGHFFTDITQSTGMLHRLLILLPNVAVKEWLLRDWGRIVFVVYLTVITLFAGTVYLLKLNLKEILKEGGIAGAVISLMVVSYVGHLTSESGGITAFSLFSVLLGLLCVVLLKLKDSASLYVKVERRRLSNFCFAAGIIALTVFLMWWVTYLIDFADIVLQKGASSPGRTKVADRPFLTVIMILAVILFVSGFLYRKADKSSLSSTKNIFIGSMIFVVLLSLFPVIYFEYAGGPYRTAMARLFMPVLKNTGLVENVEFENIPALKGVYADRKLVQDIDGLVSWLRPKIDSDPSLKNGGGIYVFPHGTSLYGILGVESFRNVYLWLSYKLTFNKLDPDTDEIIKKSPEFIVIYNYWNPLGPFEKLSKMPKLRKILQEDYSLAVQFGDFFVFQKNFKQTGEKI